MKRGLAFLACGLLSLGAWVFAQGGSGDRSQPAATSGGEAALAFPRLGSLGPEDLIFRQHQEEVAASYLAEGSGAEPPRLIFYLYVPSSAVDLFSLAARLSLPYESIASLNRLDRARVFLPGEAVLVPSAPGLFAPERPYTDLEYLLSYRGEAGAQRIPRPEGILFFYRGARYNPEERALFLGRLFRFPLPAGRMTSGFGPRLSPITGKPSVHAGVDLAAPSGTEVYAVREGKVVASGRDAVLGEYVAIEHEGGWRTIYGHLSARYARLNDKVESGIIIGRVGSTGLSTGPHLHFEVLSRGEPRDPEPLIPKR